MRTIHSQIILVLLVVGLFPSAAQSGWENGNWAVVSDPDGPLQGFKSVPDGQGGALVASFDGGSATGVDFNRLDHSGNKLWGAFGKLLPFDINSVQQHPPLGLASDGAGGGWIAFREEWASGHFVRLARIQADGTIAWDQVVADFGFTGVTTFSLEVVPGLSGDAFVVYNRDYPSDPLKAERAEATRVDANGVVQWTMDFNLEMDSFQAPGPSVVRCLPDGAGGILGVWNVQPSGQPMQTRAQRMNAWGVPLWGPDGIQVLGPIASGDPLIVSDGSNGMFVVEHDLSYGSMRVQHVDAWGSETWGPNGVVASFPGTAFAPWRDVSPDGFGGVLIAMGLEETWVQRLDAFGNSVWGGAVQITTEAGWQHKPSICADGSGGAIVAYENFYYASAQDPQNSELGAARVDLFGNVVWHDTRMWAGGWQDGYQPLDPLLVSDGSGGAIMAWHEPNYFLSDEEVRAMGFTGSGGVPTPILTYVVPDAAESGDTGPGAVLGDYLEAGDDYVLVNQEGGGEFPLSSMLQVNGQWVLGTYDFPVAPEGAYRLEVRENGSPIASMEDAFGVGPLPPCQLDPGVPPQLGTVLQAPLGTRTSAFDDAGALHASWVESSGGFSHLVHAAFDGSGWNSSGVSYSHSETIESVAAAVDGAGQLVRVLTSYAGASSYTMITYDGLGAAGVAKYFSWRVAEPTLAADESGGVHAVYVDDNVTARLIHEPFDGSGFGHGSALDLGAGLNPRSPDLIRVGNELLVIYVRDSFFPGLEEVCIQVHDGISWGSPQVLAFGFDVYSPSAAWDGQDRVLLAWVLDNSGGSAPLLHTQVREAGALGPVRPRLGDPIVSQVSVVGLTPERFALLTKESDGGPTQRFYLRSGDGNVFFPRRQVNSEADVDFPVFAAQPGVSEVFAMWNGFEDVGKPLSFYSCGLLSDVTAVVATPMASQVELRAAPNPFNPRTVLSFRLHDSGEAHLGVFDLRGRRVRSLELGTLPRGDHRVELAGVDDRGKSLASGVYIARLTSGRQDERIKLVLVK